jgi:hypothetical protein
MPIEPASARDRRCPWYSRDQTMERREDRWRATSSRPTARGEERSKSHQLPRLPSFGAVLRCSTKESFSWSPVFTQLAALTKTAAGCKLIS